MKKIRPCTDIDEASNVFIDPLVFSTILLKQSRRDVLNYKGDLRTALEKLREYVLNAANEGKTVYAKITPVTGKWNIRALLMKDQVIGIIWEEGSSSRVGVVAYEYLFKELYEKNPSVKLRASTVLLENLPSELAEYVTRCIKEKEKLKPPELWVKKEIYGFIIEKVITSKGAYMYVLLGRDSFGRKYAVKIPREKTSDGKPLAIGGSVEPLAEVIRGLLNALEVYFSNRDSLRRTLMTRGYDESLADYLIHYRNYILRPRAILLLRDIYNEDEYTEIPPLIVEDYANIGDLERRVKERPLDDRELAFLAIRVSGALALIHANQFIHMDIKPQNILLTESDEETYGYRPMVSDFVGLPHIFERATELKKTTPEYADPLALLRGYATYSYDVYSLGVTLYYAFTGMKMKTRLLLNLLILKNLYGLPVPLKVFLIDNPNLVSAAKKLEAIFSNYIARGKKLPVESLIASISATLADLDEEYLSPLDKLPERLSSVIRKSISLDEARRYNDSIAMWSDILEALKEAGYRHLIPHRL